MAGNPNSNPMGSMARTPNSSFTSPNGQAPLSPATVNMGAYAAPGGFFSQGPFGGGNSPVPPPFVPSGSTPPSSPTAAIPSSATPEDMAQRNYRPEGWNPGSGFGNDGWNPWSGFGNDGWNPWRGFGQEGGAPGGAFGQEGGAPGRDFRAHNWNPWDTSPRIPPPFVPGGTSTQTAVGGTDVFRFTPADDLSRTPSRIFEALQARWNAPHTPHENMQD